jgi:hypothetical protein
MDALALHLLHPWRQRSAIPAIEIDDRMRLCFSLCLQIGFVPYCLLIDICRHVAD